VTIKQWLADLDLTQEEEKFVGQTLADPNLKEETLQKLAKGAFKEYVEWLIGKRRFNTTSEVDAYRVFRIFYEIRNQAISTDALANDMLFSPGKATSIVSRLRYGEGRALSRLANKAAIQRIDSQVDQSSDEAQTVYLDAGEFDAVMNASSEIMRSTSEHAEGRKWQDAERPEATRDRYFSQVTASPTMWRYVKDLLGQST
jgi:hypothetical protein